MNELFGKVYGYYLLGKIKDSFKNEKGQTLVEYALILVLISIVVILMLQGTGSSVNNTFSKVNSALNP